MLQPVTKVILTRKPQLRVEQESFVEHLEVNPEENVKKKGQKSKFRLFPLAVTSIANHENIMGDNSPPLQHNWLSPSVPLQNHPALVKTCFRGSPNKAQSNLILQKNFKKSTEKSLIFKAKPEPEARTKNGGHSKKNRKINIFKEKLLVEEQTNCAPKRKKLEYFSNSENTENLKDRNILLLPRLSKNGSPNQQQQFSSTADYILKSFVKETDGKTKSRFLQGEPEEELKKLNGWKHFENHNHSEYSNSLPKIKNLPKNSVWNCFNGTAPYPHRRNLLLDWYTYDICYPLTFQSWPSAKDKNDIEIVGTQVLSQGSPRNTNEQPFIFTPEINETPNKMLQSFNGVNFGHCFNESRYEASSSNQICSGSNGSFSQNQLSHDVFLQETDSCLLWPKKIRKLSKRVTKSKQLSPIETDSILAKVNLKENGKKLSVWNHFTQQKPIQLQMSVLKQFKTVNSNRTAMIQNNRNLNLNVRSEFKENLTDKNLLYQSPTKMTENLSWKRTLLPIDRTDYTAFLQSESDKQ